MLGSRLAMATPIWALALVQIGLGLQHVRPLLHQSGGQADRNVLRQCEGGQLEFLSGACAGIAPDQDRQLVVQLRLLLDQRRQGRGGRRQPRFLRGEIQAAGIALVELVFQDLQRSWSSRVDQLAGWRRSGLATAASWIAVDNHIVDQGGVGRDHLDSAPPLPAPCSDSTVRRVQAEHIRHVGDVDLRREQVVVKGVVAGHRRQRPGLLE